MIGDVISRAASVSPFVYKSGVAAFGLVAASETGAALVNDPWSPLINLGAVGVVLLWFMLVLTPQIKKQTEAIDRLSRAVLVAIAAIRNLDPGTREQANQVLSDVEAAQAQQRK